MNPNMAPRASSGECAASGVKFFAGAFDRLAHDEVVTLSEREAAQVWASALQAVAARHAGNDPVEVAAGLISGLPSRVTVALHRFRTVGTMHNALLLRGMCADLTDLPVTPATSTPADALPVVEAAALVLLTISLALGEPFTFRSLYEGQLVQHVTPVPGRENTQTGGSSMAALQWHVEDAFTDDRCDHFGLLCLRGHPGAVTVLAPARCLDLSDDVVAILRQARFTIHPDTAHDLPDHTEPMVIPVLTGPAADPEICFDAIYQHPADPSDHHAAAALKALRAALDRAAIGLELQPGDVLLADNRRTVHGRTVFHPRYDGTDRWLLRTMTCASIRAHRRRGAIRALN
ncbi:TauD/TfdA family dioxygenase [Nocardia alni]|uniref:TauD/TfdA family dioxygenase n=1 Tax=Nocardia alni TaxID=2815723 RepID=UPI001C23F5E6|nr:TauD/TfdA family dioxygenase [Nocardia alni]